MVRQGLVLGIAVLGLVGVSRAGEVTLGVEGGHYVLKEQGRELGRFSRQRRELGDEDPYVLDQDADDLDWEHLVDEDDKDDDGGDE